MKAFIISSLLMISLPAWADPATYTDEEAVSQPVEQEPAKAQRPAIVVGNRPRQYLPPLVAHPSLKPRYFGIHIAIPGTLAVDLQVGHFYAYLSAGVGVGLFSDLSFAGATLGAGYTMPLRRTNRGEWKMEFLGIVGAGRQLASNNVYYGFYGGGVAVGFRYEHLSGFSLGFKIPVLGYEGGRHIRRTSEGLWLYYLNALASMPIVSAGYRF